MFTNVLESDDGGIWFLMISWIGMILLIDVLDGNKIVSYWGSYGVILGVVFVNKTKEDS